MNISAFFAKFRLVTHFIIAAFFAAAAFAASPAGQALVKQYPKLTAASAFLIAVAALLTNMEKGS